MKFPERHRIQVPPFYLSKIGDAFGCFLIPTTIAGNRVMKVIACDGAETGWDHVSVSLNSYPDKCPTWDEMCLVKSLFWEDSEAVMQFHPASSDHINMHKGCLHLWKPVRFEQQMPPKECV